MTTALSPTEATMISRSSTSRYGPVILDAPQVARTTNRTFAGGRERHPLPTVLPLDPTLPTAGFGDTGGDNISTIERLLERVGPSPNSPPPAPPSAIPVVPIGADAAPESSGAIAPANPDPVADSPWNWTRIGLASVLTLGWSLLTLPSTKSDPDRRKQLTLKDAEETES